MLNEMKENTIVMNETEKSQDKNIIKNINI